MGTNFYNLLSQLFINIIEFEGERYNEFPLGASCNYFGLLVKGKGRFRSSYCDFTIQEGDIVYIPKGCVYSSYWTGEEGVRFYSLGFSFMEPEKNERYSLQKMSACGEVKSGIEKMYELQDSPHAAASTFYGLYDKASAVLIPDTRVRKSLTVYPAVQYIRDHCCEDFAVAHLAGLCGMSEPYFYPVFKQEIGCSPIKYKNKLRCTMAVELLLAGEDTLEAICEKLNFSSTAFLRKLLIQETGRSPKQIRKEKYNI